MYCQGVNENNRHLFQFNINYDERTDWYAEVKDDSGEPMGFKYKIRNFEGLGALRLTRDAILLNDSVNGFPILAVIENEDLPKIKATIKPKSTTRARNAKGKKIFKN